MTTDLHMHFDVKGTLLKSARECEAEVFHQRFGNTREDIEREYGPYEDSTVFLALADNDDTVVGTVRLLAPGGRAGLKTLNDMGKDPWNVDGLRAAAAVGIETASTWEVGTIGVRQSSKGTGARLSMALYHSLMTSARVNQATSFIAILDDRVRYLLDSVGIITRAFPGTSAAPYLGSPSSTPVYAHFAPLLEKQRKQFPDAYRLVTLGIGLDGVAVPGSDAFRWRSPTDVPGSTGSVASR